MANLGFHRAMRDAGITVSATKVGDRYVLEEMLEEGVMLGGEQSGHLIFRTTRRPATGCSPRCGSSRSRRAAVARSPSSPRVMERYPQVMENVRVRSLAELDGSELPSGRRSERRRRSSPTHGRVLVRASGTEPLVRVMVEAETEDVARRHADAIAGEVRKHLGA